MHVGGMLMMYKMKRFDQLNFLQLAIIKESPTLLESVNIRTTFEPFMVIADMTTLLYVTIFRL